MLQKPVLLMVVFTIDVIYYILKNQNLKKSKFLNLIAPTPQLTQRDSGQSVEHAKYFSANGHRTAVAVA